MDSSGGAKKLEQYAMTGDDMAKVLGKIKITKYPDLCKHSIDSLFDGQGRCIILFLVSDQDSGHWMCLIRRNHSIEVFDSFGVAIDGERTWLSAEKKMQLHEAAPMLHELLDGFVNSGGAVTHNTHKLQKDDTNTCGSHVCCRLLHKDTPIDEYARQLKSQGDPDAFVAQYVVGSLLHKS